MKLTEQQLRELIPLEEVRQRFLARPDVAALPADAQERRWDERRSQVIDLYRKLAALECLGDIEP